MCYDRDPRWMLTRVRFFPEDLNQRIVQTPNVLEPILVLWVPDKQIFGSVGAVWPIRLCFRWPSIQHDRFIRFRASVLHYKVVANPALQP